MSRSYCPHCQIPLPRTVTWCPSCHQSIDTETGKKEKVNLSSLALGPTHTLDTLPVLDDGDLPDKPTQKNPILSLGERTSSSQTLDQATLPSQQAWSTKEMDTFEPSSQEIETDDTFRMGPGHGLADFSPSTLQDPPQLIPNEEVDVDLGEETAQVLTTPSFDMMMSASVNDMFQPIDIAEGSADTLTGPGPSSPLMGNFEHVGVRENEPPPEEPTRRMPAPAFTIVDGNTDASINPSMDLDVDPSEADMTSERPFIDRERGEDTFTGLLSTLGMDETKRNDLKERAEAKKNIRSHTLEQSSVDDELLVDYVSTASSRRPVALRMQPMADNVNGAQGLVRATPAEGSSSQDDLKRSASLQRSALLQPPAHKTPWLMYCGLGLVLLALGWGFFRFLS